MREIDVSIQFTNAINYKFENTEKLNFYIFILLKLFIVLLLCIDLNASDILNYTAAFVDSAIGRYDHPNLTSYFHYNFIVY